MDLINKAESLADSFNKLSEKFDVIDELTSDDIVGFVEEKAQDIVAIADDGNLADVINLTNLVNDFVYIRSTLKETTENARRVLSNITLQLIDADEEKKSSLVMAFAELNRAVGDNLKLYMASYKEVSTIILNLDKVKKSAKHETTYETTNNIMINTDPISTAEIISKLAKNK
jgi:hypothetical protein